ncbi:hypothetical protein [Rathayibacter rathayi]|uniref:hypothetical protein n=1 Tax=Rathayibacter rathayi TaxID=33887 RepID=UPI0011B00888|nr:hypothetical protein [Rathayibacter rathayi]
MYIYTDDDLGRIDRAYLGPKGRRLPFIATYRTYGITVAVLVGVFFLFMMIGLPLNEWTVLLYGLVCTMTVARIIQRMKRDVSIWSMFRAGTQEVTVPRRPRPIPEPHTMTLTIPRLAYDVTPAPRWWERIKLRRGAAATAGETEATTLPAEPAPQRPAPSSAAPTTVTAPAEQVHPIHDSTLPSRRALRDAEDPRRRGIRRRP